MIRTIKLFLTGLFLCMAFTACEKEYSTEDGGTAGTPGGGGTGTAVYTLDGTPSACSTPIITGNYAVGVALNASNTVILTVNVTTVGTYNIFTGTSNGISFSGAGTFTITGSQIIILVGSGTPASAATFSYTPGTNGCSFPITVSASGGTYTYYYEATIDGVYHKETVTSTNNYEPGSGVLGSDDAVPFANIVPLGNPWPVGSTGLAVGKGNLHGYLSASDATFKNFFNPGSYPFAPVSSSITIDGVFVAWYDENGTEWSTENTPATQTGSAFQITNVADLSVVFGYYIEVTAIFNCKLYDASGNTKTLTGGKFVGIFGKV